MTVNAFLSVSLDPPLVLVSLANRSRLHSIVSTTGRYGVSVLRDDQEHLSRHFANEAVTGNTEIRFCWRSEMPLLDGALAHLACTVMDVHPAGDHTLYVGRVDHLDYSTGSPLLFFTGEYGRLEVKLWDHSYIWSPRPWT